MAHVRDVIAQMRKASQNVKFSDVCMVCDTYFGPARQQGTSHRVYTTPWKGDPRVNIQNAKGKSKAYQVKQVLKAIDRIESSNAPE